MYKNWLTNKVFYFEESQLVDIDTCLNMLMLKNKHVILKRNLFQYVTYFIIPSGQKPVWLVWFGLLGFMAYQPL